VARGNDTRSVLAPRPGEVARWRWDFGPVVTGPFGAVITHTNKAECKGDNQSVLARRPRNRASRLNRIDQRRG
jgi:hypothetical protein